MDSSLAEDERALAEYARALTVALRAGLRFWVERQIRDRADSHGEIVDQVVRDAASAAEADVFPQIVDLLRSDIDQQWTNPLALVRKAVPYPTTALAQLGVEPPERDLYTKRLHPDDIYDLAPGSFADLGGDVAEAGLRWGAAKAHVHIRRRAGRD